MQGLSRLFRFLLPGLLLLASLGLYLGFLRPQAVLNRKKSASLHNLGHNLVKYYKEEKLIPTNKTYNSLVSLAEDMKTELRGMMAKIPEDDEVNQDLESIFEEWGYSADGPTFFLVEHLLSQGIEAMGVDNKDKITLVVKCLAISLCRSGLARLNRLECIPPTRDFSSQEDFIGWFDIDVVFTAGLTETVQFIEDWILTSGGGFLLKPKELILERVEPRKWEDNLRDYSSPPVQTNLRVSVFYTFDKG